MSYLDKRVFPTSGRNDDSSDTSIDVGTNLITEYNIASLINSVCDYEDDSSSERCGFVISRDTSDDQNGDIEFLDVGEGLSPSYKDIEFVISGYYFKISIAPDLNAFIGSYQYLQVGKEGDNIVATINIIQDDSDSGFESYRYLNHAVDNDWGTSGIKRSLLILKKKNSKWYIPGESRIRFKGYSLSGLDEGTL